MFTYLFIYLLFPHHYYNYPPVWNAIPTPLNPRSIPYLDAAELRSLQPVHHSPGRRSCRPWSNPCFAVHLRFRINKLKHFNLPSVIWEKHTRLFTSFHHLAVTGGLRAVPGHGTSGPNGPGMGTWPVLVAVDSPCFPTSISEPTNTQCHRNLVINVGITY